MTASIREDAGRCHWRNVKSLIVNKKVSILFGSS